MIGSDHHYQVGPVAVDEVQRLVDRVGRAGLPVRAKPLLRRDGYHVVVQQAVQPPGGGDVPVQAVALVLGEHADALHPAVDQVGQREIHHPVQAAERNRRLGSVRGQRSEPSAGRAREDDAQDSLSIHRKLRLRFSVRCRRASRSASRLLVQFRSRPEICLVNPGLVSVTYLGPKVLLSRGLVIVLQLRATAPG
jgi:hypothetical protein